jgi:hypothetical protein
MQEADVVLTPLPQADGTIKNRPVILLRELPPYRDFLVCGISTQLHQQVPGFDDIISPSDADFFLGREFLKETRSLFEDEKGDRFLILLGDRKFT